MKQSLFAAALLAATFVSSLAHARPVQEPKIQFPQASPAASFKDTIGLTDVTVEYARPSVKGRKIFGGLVPFGEVWRTGANAATKVTFSTDVNFGGTAVPPGSYALFTIPAEKEWAVILNKVTGQWGSYAYDAKNDVARVTVKPAALTELVETMTIGLGDLRTASATLSIAWEKTRVSVKIETDTVNVVKEQIDAAMAGEGKKPYFAAAMFYYDHDLDLKKATLWIDEAIKAEKEPPLWIIHRKGLILAKAGDKAGALAAANQSLELAKKAGGPLGAEYTRLNEALIASLK
jgi:hypothetical protein